MAIENEKFLTDLLTTLPQNHPDRDFIQASLQMTRVYIKNSEIRTSQTPVNSASEKHTLRKGSARINKFTISGSFVRELRESLDISQVALAEGAGVSRSWVAAIERSPSRSVSARTLECLASSLNTDPDLFKLPSKE